MSEDRDKLVRGVCYDADDGFVSINDTYKQSNRIFNAITLSNAKHFLPKRKSRQTKSYRGFNSYVAKEPLQELRIDLAVFTDSAPDANGYKSVFVAVDIFTKMLWAMPTEGKQPQ